MDTYDSKLDKLAWLVLSDPQGSHLDEVELTEQALGPDFRLDQGHVSLHDRAVALQRAIRHIQEAVILPVASDARALFTQLHALAIRAGAARGDQLVGQALTQLSNSRMLDVMELAIQASEEGADTLAVSRIMTEVIPQLEGLQPAALLELVERSERGDFLLIRAATQRMETEPALVESIIESCIGHPTERNGQLLRNALLLAAIADRATALSRIHTLIDGPQPELAVRAVEALGRINWAGADQVQTDIAVTVIRSGLSSQNERLRMAFVEAGLDLVSTAPTHHGLIDEILVLDQPGVAERVGDYLGFAVDHLNQERWYLEKFELLAAMPSLNCTRSHGIDHILSQLFVHDKARCMGWVATWVASHLDQQPSLPDAFPTLLEMMAEEREALGALLAQWLTHDDYHIQLAAREVLSALGLHEVTALAFSASVLDEMSDEELQLLLVRTVAHVLRDEQRVSLVWSLTQASSAEQRTYAMVMEVMADFVGYDYPQATRGYLEGIVAGGRPQPEVMLARELLEALDTYYKPLQALPQIEEVMPVSEEQHLFGKGRARLMQQSMDRASENSFVALIATRIPIKAGRSMFQVVEGRVGQSTAMLSASHSLAIPRSEIIDKVGSDMVRRKAMSMRLVRK